MRIHNVYIDGSFVGYRSLSPFFKDLGFTSTKSGKWIYTGTVYSFFRDLLSLIERYGSEARYAVTWDTKPTARREIDESYKANRRSDMTSEERTRFLSMRRQFKEISVMLRYSGITQYSCPGYEADDVLATLADMSKGKTILVVRDKDLYQVITRAVRLYDFNAEKGYKWFVGKFPGLEPEQWIDVQALTGDSTDNVTGVKGIGTKTAVKLLRSYGNLQSVLDSDVVDDKDRGTVLVARELVELKKHLLLDVVPPAKDFVKLKKILEAKRMKSVLDRLDLLNSVS